MFNLTIMKTSILQWLLLLSLSLSNIALFAQCERNEYPIIINLVQQDLKARNYQQAIERLLDARDICPDEKEEVNALIKKAFSQIEREKQTADSALDVANRVLDQMYFYEGKFGLTLKNIGSETRPQYRYGFIDRQGNEVIPFEFEEATPFSVRDGFSRVRKDKEKYLLDTAGVKYLLAERIYELRPSTEALDLHKSYLDSLPEDMVDFSKLQIILSYGTSREGKLTRIPESIGQLSQLKSLCLGWNQLSKFPESITHLSLLQALDLSKNGLSSLPESISQLSQLKRLDLRDNQLHELPESIGQLSQLQVLDLGYNDLSSLPERITQLSQLQVLDLSYNDLSSLPESISQLSQLKRLDLSWNRLSELPESIGQLGQLKRLNLKSNRLRELPESISQLSQLQVLDLGRNDLSSLPESISQLSQLQVLDLSYNDLSSLPESISQLSQLERLDLFGNKLNELPKTIGKLSQLKTLNFSANHQLGKLPENITQLSQFEKAFSRRNPVE